MANNVSVHRSATRDMAANIIGNIVFFLSLWIITAVISKVSKNSYYDVGVFSTAMSFCNVFCTLSTFASRGYMVSDVDREFSYGQYVAMRMFTIFVSAALCILIGFFMGYRGELLAAIVFYMLYRCCDAYSDVFHGIMQMEGCLQYSAYSLSAKGILAVGVFTLVLWLTQNLILAMASMVLIGILVNLLIDQRIVKKAYHEPFVKRIKRIPSIWKLLWFCAPLMINGVLMPLLVAVPRLFLQKYFSTEILGIYTSVTSPTVIISTFISSAAIPLLPYSTRAWKSGNKKIIFGFIFIPIIVIAIVCTVGVPLAQMWGGSILTMLYTAEISHYVDLFTLACVSACVLACVTLCNNMLISMRKTKQIILFAAVACVIVFAVSVPFVTKWGMYGATYALMLAYFVELVLELVYVCWKTAKVRQAEE